MNKIYTITLMLFLCSCGSEMVIPNGEEQSFHSDEPLVGFWSYSDYDNEIQLFNRVSQLPENNQGYAFFEDGEYQERANSGFCGTPPISYAVYNGSWSVNATDRLILEGAFWGGEKTDKFEIVSVNESVLKIRHIFD